MAAQKSKRRKYIFVVGGVMSSVGKGVAAASIGKLLQARGFAVTGVKIDPYVNVDAGTMNPTEHGEVFVLDDGTECDQDMGNYERFLGKDLDGGNYMTTGSVYLSVIQKERNLEYQGRCVEVVPDIPMEVIARIKRAGEKTKSDVVVVEVGGTAGDYQNILFLEAARLMRFEQPEDVITVLVSYVPALGVGGNEQKTKPTQHAIRALNSSGITPDVVLARSALTMDEKRKTKLEFICGLAKGSIFSAPDVESIYEVPINFENDGLTDFVVGKLGLISPSRDMKEWRALVKAIQSPKGEVRIGIVGKYFGSGNFFLTDAYISVLEAVKHGAYAHHAKPVIEWIDAETFEKDAKSLKILDKFNGIIVPGGFGGRGIEGKIRAIQYAREKKIPYLGLCYGMQLALIEFARNVLKLKGANTTEIDAATKFPVVDILPEQRKLMEEKNYGGTMRLGAYPAALAPKTMAAAAYGTAQISERHRHRYEVNPDYIEQFEKAGVIFAGKSPDRRLMEIMELPRTEHPFFMGTQFHPELKSRPLAPHPLFKAFVTASLKRKV